MTFSRRLVTIPGYLLTWCFYLGAAPLWLPLALVIDLCRDRRFVALRSALFMGVYLTCEVVGIVASGVLWLARAIFPIGQERWIDIHFRLEAWWGTTLFAAVVALFQLEVEVDDDADLAKGPYLLMLRHASTGDTLLASALVSRPHGIRLRYVLKRELLWDPSLDIVGNRVPNLFIDRFSDNASREVARMGALASGLGAHDGVLIYPEGTRFSPGKKARALERFRERDDEEMSAYTRSLSHVLPPRPTGTLALLEAAPEADVVVCAHTGFEGAASLADIWNGALLHQVIRVQFRRIPRKDVPTEPEAQRQWLLDQWRRVDAWVASRQASPTTPA